MPLSKSVHSTPSNKLIIGVDFDNTVISYDDILFKLTQERGLSISFPCSKKTLRDLLRQLPNGEIEWQKWQASMYGLRIGEARLIRHVGDFFRLCRMKKVSVYIISHKSEYAAQDTKGINLRTAALKWMDDNHFFSQDGLGLSQESIFFCNTRQDKIQKIKQLGCNIFIDDLEETFLEESFPPTVHGILYAPAGDHSQATDKLL
ncbi:MAG: hypothetical protein NT118_00385, partial [Lentisphaerae bacterium]|nr:hypothetical protein [Lentisphaerota bacterium]